MVEPNPECIRKEIGAGKPQDQAVAICFEKARQKMSQLETQMRLKTASLSLTGNFKKKLDF